MTKAAAAVITSSDCCFWPGRDWPCVRGAKSGARQSPVAPEGTIVQDNTGEGDDPATGAAVRTSAAVETSGAGPAFAGQGEPEVPDLADVVADDEEEPPAGEGHPKFAVSCFNVGNSAELKEYVANFLYTMPAFIAVAMDTSDAQLARLEEMQDGRVADPEWQERPGTASERARRSAFAEYDEDTSERYKLPPRADHKFIWCLTEGSLCCFGRDTRVSAIDELETWNDAKKCAQETRRRAGWPFGK